MKKKLSCLVLLLLVGLAVSPVSAAVLTSSGDAWTWDLPQYTDTQFGYNTTALALEYAPARTAASWSFFRFDIAGILGQDEQFASAKLNVYISGNTGVNPDSYYVYAIDESADTQVSDAMTLGTQPTWADDFAHSGTVVPGGVATVGWLSFDTAEILNYAKADVDGVISFAIIQGSATGGNTTFVTREHASTSVHPQFEYTVEAVPEPATMCLLALGGLSLLRRRK